MRWRLCPLDQRQRRHLSWQLPGSAPYSSTHQIHCNTIDLRRKRLSPFSAIWDGLLEDPWEELRLRVFRFRNRIGASLAYSSELT